MKDYNHREPPRRDHRYRLFYQLTRITKDKGALVNDDRLDAVALGVHYWTQQMARDAQKEENKYKDDLLDKDLKEFMRHVIGHTPKPKNFIRLGGR